MSSNTSSSDNFFSEAGKSPCLEMWVVENSKLVRWPEVRYNTFFEEDSYLVLHVCQFLFSYLFVYFIF